MGIASPVSIQVKYHGFYATLSTPRSADVTAYNPASSNDFAPGVPVTQTLRGVYSDGRLQGLEVRFYGMFRIMGVTMPPGLKPQLSNLTLLDGTYQVDSVRTRTFMGKIDGYDLVLAR